MRTEVHFAFLTATPANVAGGSGTYVGIQVLVRALEQAGHRVDLFAPDAGRPLLGMTASRIWFNLRARRKAMAAGVDVLVGFDMDGVFVPRNGPYHVAAIKGILAEEAGFERGLVRASMRIQAFFESWHVRRADQVVSTSEYAADRIAEHYHVRAGAVSVVPELIDLPRWQSALSSAHPEPRTTPVVLCVAHLYPRKSIDTLLRATKLFDPSVQVRVVGLGPERARLEGLAAALKIEKQVVFLGHIPFARLVGEYCNATVFCLPSRQEGFGIVFLEAMAAGLPIVACRTTAVPEVVLDGECGVLVAPGDDRALAEAISALIGNKAERTRLGRGGRQRAGRFDAQTVAAEFVAIIQAKRKL